MTFYDSCPTWDMLYRRVLCMKYEGYYDSSPSPLHFWHVILVGQTENQQIGSSLIGGRTLLPERDLSIQQTHNSQTRMSINSYTFWSPKLLLAIISQTVARSLEKMCAYHKHHTQAFRLTLYIPFNIFTFLNNLTKWKKLKI